MRRKSIVTSVAIGIFSLAFCAEMRAAGSNSAEEAAIRKLIAAQDRNEAMVPRTPDNIFWSGAYKRPIVAPEKGQPFTGRGGTIEDRVPRSQKTSTEVIRIVVADSGDLAYEYSKSTLEFDLKNGNHVKFDTGLLRVWQKQDGAWKQAAFFVRPYDAPDAPSTTPQ
jgi:ketosteroid isomerase-like protein